MIRSSDPAYSGARRRFNRAFDTRPRACSTALSRRSLVDGVPQACEAVSLELGYSMSAAPHCRCNVHDDMRAVLIQQWTSTRGATLALVQVA